MTRPDYTLSVIIPTKNRLELLKRALTSVAVQNYSMFEICVVDNNADKELNYQVKKAVEGFEKEYGHLTWRYIHSKKQFASGARNEGMAAATGDYIIFLDDDDELLDSSIKIRMDEMTARPEIALLYCAGYSKIYPYPFKMYRYYHYNKALHTGRLMMMSCSSIMINKGIFKANNLWFDEKQSRMDDYDLCKMVIKLDLGVKSIPQPLVLIHLHPETRISSRKVIDYDFKNALIERWGPAEADTVYSYAEGVYIWRKCFGVEERSFQEIRRTLRTDFDRPPTLSFRFKFLLVSISPLLFLCLYHVALFISQSYKNSIAYSSKR